VGREFLNEEVFGETQRTVHQFARANPISGVWRDFVIYATEAQPGKPSPFEDIVSMPMAPFTALKGVDRTASSVYAVRSSMERISDIVEELPEAIQWQMLLLLIEMEETEVVKSILTSMSKVSDSSVQLAETAEKWPETIREQASILIQEIDTKQANLQVTLDKAEKTAAAFDQTAKSVNEVVRGIESAANATGEVIKEWGKMVPKEDTSPKTDVNDYRDIIQQAIDAVNEIRVLTAEVRDLLESGTLAAHIKDVNSLVDDSVVHARGLTDHAIWRMMQLIASVFVLALLYRLALGRFAVRRRE